jgi:hypothetical protein
MCGRAAVGLPPLGGGAEAQDEPRWALVIGNDDYEHVGDLGAAVNDAKRWRHAARARLRGARAPEPHPGRDVPGRAPARRARRRGGGGRLLRRARGAGRRPQLPAAGRHRGGGEGDVEDNAVPVDDVLNLLAGAKAKLTVAFLDACRDNPLPPACAPWARHGAAGRCRAG